MTIQQIRDLALKLFGVYYLMAGVSCLPQLVAMLHVPDSAHAAGRTASILAIAMYGTFWLVSAWIFLARTQAISARLWPESHDAPAGSSFTMSLASCISLVGLFYLLGAVSGLISKFWVFRTLMHESGFSWERSELLGHVVTAVIALVITLNSRAIAEGLKRRMAPPAAGE